MNIMNTELKAQLVAVFTNQVQHSITHTFNRLVATYGASMKGVYNSRNGQFWKYSVSVCCDRSNRLATADYILNAEKVALFADQMADEMANEVLAKVNAKVANLQDSKVVLVSGANFVITGTKNGQNVRIEQNQIINVSVKGNLFNQYPSRIYVNGKFTSAAKFANI
jgi:hypothetical protein